MRSKKQEPRRENQESRGKNQEDGWSMLMINPIRPLGGHLSLKKGKGLLD